MDSSGSSVWMPVQLVTFWMLYYLFSCTQANHDAKRLYDDLLKKSNYNRLIRPVQNSNETLEVKLGLKLSQLADVHGNEPSCDSPLETLTIKSSESSDNIFAIVVAVIIISGYALVTYIFLVAK
ncbi:hypothetical protein LSH36_136g05043 [Paralvinella palmiformis]|uniref:Neurotransmitter-gated ion-channel ligand-binding domain-containing protein n=1 Tax=Paralvinella palmiformis TaxID=53620 RepID=A0AAD9JW18_9ANNE|nr:hypothetical protein LSH36_136g05043 [Paralvinella palmiformis]